MNLKKPTQAHEQFSVW